MSSFLVMQLSQHLGSLDLTKSSLLVKLDADKRQVRKEINFKVVDHINQRSGLRRPLKSFLKTHRPRNINPDIVDGDFSSSTKTIELEGDEA